VIYELCALSPPFLAPNQHTLASKVASGKVKDIPGIYSHELNTVIKKLLNIEPALRPEAEVLLKSTHSLWVLTKEHDLHELNKRLSKWHKQLLKKEQELEQREQLLQKMMTERVESKQAVSLS
jgi:serine/threonine protein kinase